MKRALIAGLGILALIVGVQAANAQANINPNVYPNNAGERYGVSQQPYEWHAAPGPNRRNQIRARPRSGERTSLAKHLEGSVPLNGGAIIGPAAAACRGPSSLRIRFVRERR